MMREESGGHMAWLDDGTIEAIGHSDDVYLAPAHCPIGLDGYRQGARWECSLAHWRRHFAEIYAHRVSP